MRGSSKISCRPATRERIGALLQLLDQGRSAQRCYCTWFRARASSYNQASPDTRREMLQGRVATGELPPGIIGYDGETAVGWISVGPVDEYRERLDHWSVSRLPIPSRAWVIVCMFVVSPWRHRRVGITLIEAATAFAREHGATRVLAFPLVAKPTRAGEGSTGVGWANQYLQAGFELGPGGVDGRPIASLRINR